MRMKVVRRVVWVASKLAAREARSWRAVVREIVRAALVVRRDWAVWGRVWGSEGVEAIGVLAGGVI
jgi:hypothetical protein